MTAADIDRTDELREAFPENYEFDADQRQDGLWDRRPELAHVRDFARARRASPQATLAVVLAYAAAAVEPNVVLPPIIGTHASLNLFVALVGPSGGGKGAAEGAARDAVRFARHDGSRIWTETFPPGSGEGIARCFTPYLDDQDKDGDGKPTRKRRTRAVFSAPEVDTLAALGGRRGSTLLPELRKVYSGEQIGFKNASDASTSPVEEHSYRACLIVGVQPAKAGALLDDSAGGTPQRFVWMPVDDPDAPDAHPDCPPQRTVRLPYWGRELVELNVPNAARSEILAHRLAVLRGNEEVDPLDGHLLLCRLKVAAALMLLGGRSVLSEDDWRLAQEIMRVSASTRTRAKAAIAARKKSANRARAHDDAERAAIIDETREQAEVKRTRRRVLERLRATGPLTRGDLNRSLRSELRGHLDHVLACLLEESQVVASGDGRTRYAIAN
jgi:hypothetical protein